MFLKVTHPLSLSSCSNLNYTCRSVIGRWCDPTSLYGSVSLCTISCVDGWSYPESEKTSTYSPYKPGHGFAESEHDCNTNVRFESLRHPTSLLEKRIHFFKFRVHTRNFDWTFPRDFTSVCNAVDRGLLSTSSQVKIQIHATSSPGRASSSQCSHVKGTLAEDFIPYFLKPFFTFNNW